MRLDPDFSEFIALLRAHDARFLIVGGYAVALHGHPRYTGDLDVWLLVGDDNARAVLAALQEFGFGGVGLDVEDFTGGLRGDPRACPRSSVGLPWAS